SSPQRSPPRSSSPRSASLDDYNRVTTVRRRILTHALLKMWQCDSLASRANDVSRARERSRVGKQRRVVIHAARNIVRRCVLGERMTRTVYPKFENAP